MIQYTLVSPKPVQMIFKCVNSIGNMISVLLASDYGYCMPHKHSGFASPDKRKRLKEICTADSKVRLLQCYIDDIRQYVLMTSSLPK